MRWNHLSIAALAGFFSCAQASAQSSYDPYSPTIAASQQESDNYVEIQSKPASQQDTETMLLQQDATDQNGNRAIVVQQGLNNVSDYTQAGRVNNVISTGNVAAQSTSPAAPAVVDQFGTRTGTPYTLSHQP
ncbi:MAG: hypothetical protein JO089_01480 [Alphaproteobacteria bacterium]|nr:hypothetical protein [Alphaproteobacteria bacterium]